MKFTSREEKLKWLKLAAGKIRELEFNRRFAIVQKDFKKAYQLLRAMDYAKAEFKRVSNTLRPK